MAGIGLSVLDIRLHDLLWGLVSVCWACRRVYGFGCRLKANKAIACPWRQIFGSLRKQFGNFSAPRGSNGIFFGFDFFRLNFDLILHLDIDIDLSLFFLCSDEFFASFFVFVGRLAGVFVS
jgi:hypothetical protein